MNTPPSPPPGSQFPALSALAGYKPSGKTGALGLPLALISLVLLPIFLAFLYVKSAHFGLGLFSSMWFLVGAALLLGLAVGLGFFPAIQWGKIRNPTLMATLGLLAGIATYGLSLYVEANDHRAEIAPSALGSPVAMTQSYLAGRAEKGQQVSGRRGRGANIDGGMFWALIGVEGLLCALGAAIAANLLAGRRYSEEVARWMKPQTLFTFPHAAAPELVAIAQQGDWPNFAARARALKNPSGSENLSNATVYTTPEKPGGILQIRSVVDPKQPIATVYDEPLSPAQLHALSAEFPAPIDASAPTLGRDVRSD